LSVCKDIDKLSEVAWVQGSFFIIEKKVFDQLQGFDEQYFLYKEEEDLQLRIRLLGNKILYNPNISIDHI
jgi:GT2 family glycosyltransferase